MSALAVRVCRADAQVVCARTINAGLQLLATMLFVGVLAEVAGLGSLAAVLATLPAAGMLWWFQGGAQLPVEAQQGAPSVRDLVVLAGLAVIAWVCRRRDRGRGAAAGWAALGVLCAVGVFWAYNRGLVLVVTAGLFGAARAVLMRSVWPVLWMGVGGVLGLTAVVALAGPQIVPATLSDIAYWQANGAMWLMPLIPAIVAPAFVLGLLVVAGVPLVRAGGRPGRVSMLAVLGCVAVLYAVQSATRPDIPHMRFVVWPLVLALGLVLRDRAEALRLPGLPPGAAGLAGLVVLAGVCIESYGERSIVRTAVAGLGGNVRALTRPAPTDAALAGPDQMRIAALVRAAGRCTFAANNAGIVHLLSGMPPCSRFVFGAYVAADQQESIIAELVRGAPEIIVWDSPDWWAHIDGRDFEDRAPVLAAWIRAAFPVRTMVGPHVLLSRRALMP